MNCMQPPVQSLINYGSVSPQEEHFNQIYFTLSILWRTSSFENSLPPENLPLPRSIGQKKSHQKPLKNRRSHQKASKIRIQTTMI
jgi:hypothetical protein